VIVLDLLAGLKAMADETRLKILTMVSRERLCVEALARRLEISESSVSQHLKKLREADLVSGEKRGYYVHYRVKNEVVAEFSAALENLSAHVEVPEKCSEEEHEDECCRKSREGC